jgi:membrane-bound serine protease (ClpP class)
MSRWLAFIMALVLWGMAPSLEAGDAGLIRINGTIAPATASYISRALAISAERGDVCLIIQMDTPGGLLDSTKDIVQSFYAAEIPVVVFVAPSGANAGSAGCFITLAADVAAMAPNTSIGAAHPVAMGAGGTEKQDDVMKKKLENFASSYIEAIAEKRGRNVEWARASVLESESITAEKALEKKVIDLIASDNEDLLKKLDGREVGGRKLSTAGANTIFIPMLAREKVFQLLWRPEFMLILMLAAIYGIIGELSNPGAILPGVVGGISLILVLYMSAVLPVNIAGFALIGLALLLFIADIFAPTHGVLTFGGVAAFFLGALMLFDRNDPAFHLPLGYIIPATLLTAAFFVFVVGAGIRAQFLPVKAGRETMVGKTAPVVVRIDASGGRVFVEGEYWNATSPEPVEAGQTVEILSIEGLTLKVKHETK